MGEKEREKQGAGLSSKYLIGGEGGGGGMGQKETLRQKWQEIKKKKKKNRIWESKIKKTAYWAETDGEKEKKK